MISHKTRTLMVMAALAAAAPAAGRTLAQSQKMRDVPRWTCFEAELTSKKNYTNPVQDVTVEVEFTSPSGKRSTVPAFWDGGKTWRVRFSPDEEGRWTWVSRCSLQEDKGLHERRGDFRCVAYRGANPLYRRGTLRLSENRRYLVHADNSPFFWLGDTAWNGVLLSSEQDWEVYLKDRAEKGFTAVKFVTTQWRAATGDADGRTAFSGKEKIAIDPLFFQRMDKRVDAINAHGLIAAPILIWSCCPGAKQEMSPGFLLPDDQIVALARYMIARYGGHQVIWIIGGDGDYRGDKAQRWRKIGLALLGPGTPGSGLRLATIHPGGRHWVADEFRNEPWFSFNGYQSGHGDNDDTFRWLTLGPPSQSWKKEPVLPDINLEPNYEAHNGYTFKRPHDAHAVRRAAYWSLLVTPPAGVSYGAHGIWSWQLKAGEPLNHAGSGVAAPWHEAMRLPGSMHMKHLKKLFSSLEWWKLRPAQAMLAGQAGGASHFVAVAAAEDATWALLYIPAAPAPTGETAMERAAAGRSAMMLFTQTIKEPAAHAWFNPRTGEWSSALPVTKPIETFFAPDAEDWVLWLGPASSRPR